MNDNRHQAAKALDAYITARQAGHSPWSPDNPNLVADLVELAEATRPPPEFIDSLRRQLLSHSSQGLRRRRVWLLAPTALLVTIIIAFVVSPPLQAWAQEVLTRVGALTITDAPTAAEREFERVLEEGRLRPMDDLGVGRIAVDRFHSEEEARGRASFELLLPTYLSDGLRLISIEIIDDGTSDVPQQMYGTYYTGGGHPLEDSLLLIWQAKSPQEFDYRMDIGDAEITEVTVRGRDGVWIEQVSQGITGRGSVEQPTDLQLLRMNVLIWKESGFVVQLSSDDYGFEEMLKIAESLSP